MGFRTKLDYSDNRQIKQHIETLTHLSGGTIFGVPFSYLPTGPNMGITGTTEEPSDLISTFSGNSGTSIFTWYDNRMQDAYGDLSAFTPSNSGITQYAESIFSPSSVTTIDGNTVVLSWTGVSYDLYAIAMYDLGGGNYSGTVKTDDLFIYSADTLDFTDRTIWVDVSGITRTDRLIVSRAPQVGYVLTCLDSEGMAGWLPSSGGTGGGIVVSGSPFVATIEGGNTGITKSNRIVANYGNIGQDAVDCSFSDALSSVRGATGLYSFAEGYNTRASGDYGSHAEGFLTVAVGDSSHAEGSGCVSTGTSAHAEGEVTYAYGIGSHAEGGFTTAWGQHSHAEGSSTTAIGNYSHAEGDGAIASGLGSHAEGGVTTAWGQHSHAEGSSTTASGSSSHAEGEGTVAGGNNSHAQNGGCWAMGTSSHAGGTNSKAFGGASFVHGSDSEVSVGGLNSIVLGANITGTTPNTTYVDNLNIKTLGGAAVTDIGVDANGYVRVQASDITLKENINTIENALDKVKNLRGVKYQWKDRNSCGDEFRIGFIAQEVYQVEPLLVNNIGNDLLGVQYKEVTALLVEAIKELASGITSSTNSYLETQTILAEDNNIQLNYNGTEASAVGGGIEVLHAKGDGVSVELNVDSDGNWVTNNDFKPSGLTIPYYTPESTSDTHGNEGNITRDDNHLYVKTNTGWKRTNLENF